MHQNATVSHRKNAAARSGKMRLNATELQNVSRMQHVQMLIKDKNAHECTRMLMNAHECVC